MKRYNYRYTAEKYQFPFSLNSISTFNCKVALFWLRDYSLRDTDSRLLRQPIVQCLRRFHSPFGREHARLTYVLSEFATPVNAAEGDRAFISLVWLNAGMNSIFLQLYSLTKDGSFT